VILFCIIETGRQVGRIRPGYGKAAGDFPGELEVRGRGHGRVLFVPDNDVPDFGFFRIASTSPSDEGPGILNMRVTPHAASSLMSTSETVVPAPV
jgi:hypothetical protein